MVSGGVVLVPRDGAVQPLRDGRPRARDGRAARVALELARALRGRSPSLDWGLGGGATKFVLQVFSMFKFPLTFLT